LPRKTLFESRFPSAIKPRGISRSCLLIGCLIAFAIMLFDRFRDHVV